MVARIDHGPSSDLDMHMTLKDSILSHYTQLATQIFVTQVAKFTSLNVVLNINYPSATLTTACFKQ